MNIFKKLFGSSKKISEPADQNNFEKEKLVAYEKILGKQDNMVAHAIVPFCLGGSLCIFSFSNSGLPGTALTTTELVLPKEMATKPSSIGPYEFISFTRMKIKNKGTAIDPMLARMSNIFTMIARYAENTILNPNSTLELPDGSDKTLFFILDRYNDTEIVVQNIKFNLMLCIEIFESESVFARKNGGKELIGLLKKNEIYPFSDLKRNPVC